MIRLALVLALFVSLALADMAKAGASPSPEAPLAGTRPPVEVAKGSERLDEPRPEPRWIPRQARRQKQFGPAVTPYPVLFTPTGIPSLPF